MIPDLAKSAEKLCYFFEIANHGSLQATSRKLGVAAPSLSISLKQLEHVVGAPLFHRSKKGVRLTEAGEKLFHFCRKYFRDLEEVHRNIEFPDNRTPRKIKIGTFQSIALYFWPMLIDSFKNDMSFSFSITTDRSKGILESLIRQEVDIALTVETINHEKLIQHELYQDEYSFYVPSYWKKATLAQNEIHEHTLLYIPDAIDETGRTLRQLLHGWHLTFKDEFELDSLELIGDFIKRGYGVGILPTKVAKTYGAQIRQIKIEGLNFATFGRHRFFLSYRDDLEMPQSQMQRILDILKRATAQLGRIESDNGGEGEVQTLGIDLKRPEPRV